MLVPIKSKFIAETRRYHTNKESISNFDDFYSFIETNHSLGNVAFSVFYIDPNEGDELPINNNENLGRAIEVTLATPVKPCLRLILSRKDIPLEKEYSFKKKNNFLNEFIPFNYSSSHRIRPQIGLPQDFREVSSIIDVDIVPASCRRVRLIKHSSDKPLGFYIRDGNSVRVLPNSIERVPGVFISRLVPGGIAESTGLLSINDEILEVNGIDVTGKSLNQVTDMMIANSSNLIITIRPAVQSNLNGPLNSSIPSISDDEDNEIHDNSYFSS
ncbi:partitioning defective 6 homolog beta-like [Panonychus citri]|uniref:partitioning defective 6 homolog beta-like n=1 Tax=Panonychus citri TaxID=50023 RepID=UPI00230752CE|nr:partitioning defective 6 homolog beta-like [Panonychus citri]